MFSTKTFLRRNFLFTALMLSVPVGIALYLITKNYLAGTFVFCEPSPEVIC